MPERVVKKPTSSPAPKAGALKPKLFQGSDKAKPVLKVGSDKKIVKAFAEKNKA